MKSHTHRYILLLSALCGFCTSLPAQNLNESLTVEGTFTPEIIAADRLSLSPAVVGMTAPQSHLSYDLEGVAANFTPDALGMPATAWSASRIPDTSRGYLNLRLGSWLDSSLSAGYAAIDNEETHLNLRFQHNSTSLWQAWKADPGKGQDFSADRRFRYDETIGAGLRHRIAGAGTVKADLQYHLGYFNYYATSMTLLDDNDRYAAPTQTLNDLYARVGWAGETSGAFSYGIDADIRYFGYRAGYLLTQHVLNLHSRPGQRETMLNVGANAAYRLSGSHRLALGISYTGLFNSNKEFFPGEKLDVNRLRILPAYEYEGGSMTLRIGADLAVESASESKFRIAPDVRFTARSGIASFSASIGGGTHLRSLAWLHEMDYYSSPLAVCDHAAYTPIDARLAFQLNPGGKWTFGLEGFWRTTLDETFGGRYQEFLNYSGSFDAYMPLQADIRGFSVGVNAGYDFCRYFGLKGKANWQPQHGGRGVLNGFDRPAVTASLSALSRPTDALSISLDYNLRAKRYLLDGNISRLNLAADYRISDRLCVGVELRNLLNRHEMLLPSLPSEGITATAGFQILF